MIDPLTGIDDGGPIVYSEDATGNGNVYYNPPASDLPVVTTNTDTGGTTTGSKINWMILIAIAAGLYFLRKK